MLGGIRALGGVTTSKQWTGDRPAEVNPVGKFQPSPSRKSCSVRISQANSQSLTLIPGEPIPLYVNRDFQITNAALAEDLTSETGRSVVKVTHNPISQSAFESDSDSDDDESFEGDEDESSSDDDEVEGEGADDDDEDDDEDMEDDSDDEEDDLEETSVLCALTPGKCEQAVLNLTFVQGEVVIFEVSGEK